jgi:two-component system, NtrC family, response regulator PilR
VRSILVVEDEKNLRDFLSFVLRKEGYSVTTAEDGMEGMDFIKKEIYDLVLTDVKMPRAGGLDVLKAVKETSPDTVVLMITAFASTETAVEAMKQGAYDYISKPFQIDEVKLVIRNALERKQLERDNLRLRLQLKERIDVENLVGKSPAMQKVYEVIRKVADTKSNVLILGESGTGKELVARAIHFNSGRKDAPFVAVNCGALPEPLLESELFGHVKGAFTGAHANKEGLFEVANGGAVFLDEIGETPPSIQVKLLRVLEEKEFRRIGGTKNIKVDIRIIAATNKDLEKAVAEGSFREDLFYRLDVIPIHLPPLRERSEDIVWLTDHFLEKFCRTSGVPVKKIAPEAMRLLQSHEWRGNVRELENMMERTVAMVSGETITERDIGGSLERPVPSRDAISTQLPPEGLDLESFVEELEKTFLQKALKRTGGVKREAAKLLGLNMRSFRYRLQKYGLGKARLAPLPAGDSKPSDNGE